MKPGMVIFLVVILVAGFVIANRMSYADGLKDQQFKCGMIKDKAWPDVDNFYAKYCRG
ncbi:hypothetical protein D3C77_349360 [compost metagenome]